MIAAFLLNVLLAAGALAAPVTGHARRGNITLLTLGDGAAEVGWISESSFRFTRCWEPVCMSREPVKTPVEVKFTSTPKALTWETRYLRLRLDRSTLTLRAELVSDGALLFAQQPVVRAAPAGLTAAVGMQPHERIYGLAAYGLSAEGKLDVRGERLATATPFFISSRGYGVYYAMPGIYGVDAGATEPERLQVRNGQARQWEQFVYYGPTPKEILEEHHIIAPPMPAPKMDDLRLGKPAYARDIPGVRGLAVSAMSGVLAPAIKQVLAWSEYMSGPRWEPYLYTYLCEARDRGIPVVRPLVMQFTSDEAAAAVTGTFMIGDEVLVAARERTYLPPGVWTDLATGATHRGRQWITVETPPRRFARNGTILPQQAPGLMELHYFPRLGAEFFLSEPDSDGITQVHAAPAGGLLRLEIESLAARSYEWVVHNVSAPRQATAIGAPEPVPNYDAARRELRIKVDAPAGANVIVNVDLADPL